MKRQADLLRVVGEMAPDVLQRATTKVLSAEMEGVDLQAPPHIELNDGEVWVNDSLATSTARGALDEVQAAWHRGRAAEMMS